jgi:hypothetical protein
MRERRLQQVGGIVTSKFGIRHVGIIDDGRVEQRSLYCVCRNQLDHTSQEHALQFESALVICIGQDEECILQYAKIVLLEELVRYLSVCRGEVVDDFQAYCRGDEQNTTSHQIGQTYDSSRSRQCLSWYV